MYAYMILMLFTVGTMTAASMGILSINDTTQKTMKASDDARILTLWENSIGAALINGGTKNELIPPSGEDATSKVPFTTPPAWISAPRNNAYGRPIIYCPVSQKNILDMTLPIETLKMPGGSYKANVVTASNSHEYVSASDISLDPSISRSNVLAFIISQLGDKTPSCTDVTYNKEKGKFYVNEKMGVVRVITPASRIDNGSDDTQDGEKVDYSSAVSGWALTAGSDYIIDADQEGSFNSAVNIAKYDSNNTLQIKANGSKKIQGSGSGISLDGVRLVLINVDASSLGTITVKNGQITAYNSTLPAVKLTNSSMNLKGANTISGNITAINSEINSSNANTNIKATDNLVLTNTKWIVTESSSLAIDTTGKTPINLISGSELRINDSSMSIKGNRSNADYMVFIDPSSKLVSYYSSISLDTKSTWGVFDQGLFQLSNSNLTPTVSTSYLVGVYDGGKIHADSSNIGSSSRKNAYGVVLESVNFASGNQTNVYSGSLCLTGTSYNGFKRIPDSISNSYSWSCK
jgi:hypothetical protein